MIEELKPTEETIFVNKRSLPDGTERIDQIEYPNGAIEFGVTVFPDRIRSIERVEFADKTIFFDVVERPDKTLFIGIANFLDGFVWRNVSGNFDADVRADVVETENGKTYLNEIRNSENVWIWSWTEDDPDE